MSDTNPTAAAPPAPAPSEAAPVAAAPVAQPPTSVVVPAAAPPEPTPAATPEPTPVAEPGAEPAAPEPTPEAAAPTEAPAEPAAPEPAAPAYTEFKLPEGVSILPAKMAEATSVLAKYGVPQEEAQELVTLHAAALQSAVENYGRTATDFWNNKAKEWVAEVKADPNIGGNRFDTSIRRARAVWTEVLPNDADRTRLFGDLTDTKMGDHPVLARALSEVGRRFEQVLAATGTTTWADAMKKLREPGAPPPGTPARAPGANARPADRRYNGART